MAPAKLHRTPGGTVALFVVLLLMFGSGCGGRRAPIPPGVIPEQTTLPSADEQYGHEVFSSLTDTYPIDRDDERINRVRDIVDRLTKAAGADKNPWNVYVLVDDGFKNAAATRGNYIFVWTGMLKTVQTDAELATVLAHEIGHVLAGHTAADPMEETARIIAGVAGAASGQVVAHQGLAPVADLAELLIRASLEAMLLNPDLQAKELEADQVGLFIMADAGYDPQRAVDFWRRMSKDPDFGGSPLQFMSSHPTSTDRVEQLEKLLPAAGDRFKNPGAPKMREYRSPDAPRPRAAGKEDSFAIPEDGGDGQQSSRVYRPPLAEESAVDRRQDRAADLVDVQADRQSHPARNAAEQWTVVDPSVPLRREPRDEAELVRMLQSGEKVQVTGRRGRWLEISEPTSGFVRGRQLSPQ